MRSAAYLLVLAGFLAVQAAEVEVEEGVLVMTNDNFKQVTDENQFVLVEFYAPWCGHCKALAPEYVKAAAQLEEEGSEIKLAKVDATEQGDLASQFGVRGYPTIKFFKNGQASDYGGGRTAKDIVSWLSKRIGPPAEALDTAEDAQKFSEKDDVVVIGFFEDTESDNAKAYTNAADTQDTIYFGIVTAKDVAEAMEATMDSIVVFKKFDEGRATFDKKFTTENIVTFVLGEQLPLVSKFSDETAPKIFGGDAKTHLLAFYEGDNEDYLSAMKEVAQEFKGKVLFVQVDTGDDASTRVSEFFGIEAEDVPTCRLINLEEDMKKFVPEFEGLAADDMRIFVNDYMEGKLKVHLNTEEIPEDWNANNVKVLVGKNFEDVAMDSTKHVFVEFYAPWCGHCKQLAPIWDELGDHFADDKDVVIAKMDSTKNEVEAVQVQAFPAIKFITKDTNQIIDYNGDRTLDEMIEYVERKVAGLPDEEEEEEDGPDDESGDDGSDDESGDDGSDVSDDEEEEPMKPKEEL